MYPAGVERATVGVAALVRAARRDLVPELRAAGFDRPVGRRSPLGRDPDDLRAEGFTKVDCIKATVDLLRLPLADAKRVVHDSQTWADVQGREDEWHDSLVAEMDATESRS